jgi:hypothetical protein
MENDEDNKYKDEEDSGLKVNFLSVIFIGDFLVTGGDDGYVNHYLLSKALNI